MAALLVGMTVAAVLMTAAMPVWKQMTRREREAELVFRGEQYARAIGLFQKRSGPGVLPPDVDVLVSGRFLRKKFKDPITNDDFNLLSPTQEAGGASPVAGRGNSAQGQAPGVGGGGGRGALQQTGTGAVISNQSSGRGAVGGIIGVASKSKDASLRMYNGRTRYDEWQFIFVPQVQAPNAPGGTPGAGGGANGQPQRGGQPPGGIPGGFGGVGGRGGQGNGRGQGRGQQPPGANQGGRGLQTPPPPAAPNPSTSPFAPRR